MSGNAGQGGALACKTVAAVRLDGIHKAYGTVRALSGLDVTLAAGEIHAFLGSNGAGKTTAIGIMTGLRRADSGSVEVLGGDPQDVAVRRRIGLTPQESGFPNNLRVSEIIRLVRAHYATPLSDADLFARFPLQAVWRRQAGRSQRRPKTHPRRRARLRRQSRSRVPGRADHRSRRHGTADSLAGRSPLPEHRRNRCSHHPLLRRLSQIKFPRFEFYVSMFQ